MTIVGNSPTGRELFSQIKKRCQQIDGYLKIDIEDGRNLKLKRQPDGTQRVLGFTFGATPNWYHSGTTYRAWTKVWRGTQEYLATLDKSTREKLRDSGGDRKAEWAVRINMLEPHAITTSVAGTLVHEMVHFLRFINDGNKEDEPDAVGWQVKWWAEQGFH